MPAILEHISYPLHEDPCDPLSRKALVHDIQRISEALQNPYKLHNLAQQQHMDQYADRELVTHYTNHRRQYQSFYKMFYGKKLIPEGDVAAIIRQGGRRGR